MEPARDGNWAEQFAAAQAWWREAGVDLAFAEEPTDWLAAARAANAVQADPVEAKPASAAVEQPPPRPSIGGDRERWPAALSDFAGWWLTEPSLDPSPAARRVPPAGPANPALMVVVPTPEADDRERLLGGRQGALLDAILTAFGLRREAVYLASILPCPSPVSDWAALAANGMDAVLRRHVALAAPERLLVFGRDVSPLLGHDPAQSAAGSLHFNHDGGSVRLAVAPALEALLERPALKRGVWRRWLEWTET